MDEASQRKGDTAAARAVARESGGRLQIGGLDSEHCVEQEAVGVGEGQAVVEYVGGDRCDETFGVVAAAGAHGEHGLGDGSHVAGERG